MDWRYRYSASGEREQKRLVYTAAWDSVVGYPWMYYLLGGSNEQLAVYHGQQRSGTGLCGDTGRRVYMYPAEYLTHGVAYTGVQEDISQVITDASGNKQYRIADHLASLRVTLDATGTSHDDFDPWGNLLPKGATLASRRGYNDREKDRETGRLNLGVRSLGDGDHFTSIDPLWEKAPNQSSYLYSSANPVRLTDPDGKQTRDILSGEERQDPTQNTSPGGWDDVKSADGTTTSGIQGGGSASLNSGSPTSPIWTATRTRTSLQNALEHWQKHEGEFPELFNAGQYVKAAKAFFSNPPAGTLTKNRPNGDMLFYDPQTNTFGVQAMNGAPKTMFRPGDGVRYWKKQ